MPNLLLIPIEMRFILHSIHCKALLLGLALGGISVSVYANEQAPVATTVDVTLPENSSTPEPVNDGSSYPINEGPSSLDIYGPPDYSGNRVTEEVIVEGSDLPIWAIRKIEPMRSKVSGWVDATSRNLDSYFGTDEFLDVDNKSYLRLSQEMEWMDSEGFEHSIGTRFKVDMPTTKERIKLVFESNPEETQSEEEERNRRAANHNIEETKNSTVIGIEQTSDTDPKKAWKVRTNAGLKLRAPLDPYLRVTSRRLWEQEEGPWYLDSRNRASWFV